MSSLRLPPGPPQRLFSPAILPLLRDPLAYLTGVARTHGPIASFRIARRRVVLVNDPALIQAVLVTHHAKFTKGYALQRARLFLGDGLLTSEAPAHRRQRRLVQPAFHRQRLATYAATMSAAALRARQAWPPGEIRDLTAEMSRLTLDIVGRTLFSADVEADAHRVGSALTTLLEGFNRLLLPLPAWWQHLPLPGAKRLRDAQAALDQIVRRLIHQRRASGIDAGDLLSTLVFSEDADHPGEHLSDDEVRDQALTLFLAGHETTANALAWTWYLLARHPRVADRLHAELAEVLAGRPPAFDDLPRLPFTQQILRETLRLYPPAWCLGRRAIAPIQLGDYDIPAGSIVLASPWVTHRDRRFFADPHKFIPERWTESNRDRLPHFAYFPFGGGPRTCIGEGFAWMELTLILATLAQTWRPLLLTDDLRPLPSVTLRPDRPLRMRLRTVDDPPEAVKQPH